jgi:hypothetical protein
MYIGLCRCTCHINTNSRLALPKINPPADVASQAWWVQEPHAQKHFQAGSLRVRFSFETCI